MRVPRKPGTAEGGPRRKSGTGRNVPRQELPVKTCAACGRPFSWRKKWERVWEEVRYCSDRCRQKR